MVKFQPSPSLKTKKNTHTESHQHISPNPPPSGGWKNPTPQPTHLFPTQEAMPLWKATWPSMIFFPWPYTRSSQGWKQRIRWYFQRRRFHVLVPPQLLGGLGRKVNNKPYFSTQKKEKKMFLRMDSKSNKNHQNFFSFSKRGSDTNQTYINHQQMKQNKTAPPWSYHKWPADKTITYHHKSSGFGTTKKLPVPNQKETNNPPPVSFKQICSLLVHMTPVSPIRHFFRIFWPSLCASKASWNLGGFR